jgi:hypothetical protein
VQYSSYDRRSAVPGAKFWNANADGFGNEPIPGFAQVLKAPGEDHIGEYLICDVKGPGAIVRTWTAGMGGTITMTLGDADKPMYAGPAMHFFQRMYKEFADSLSLDQDLLDCCFSQRDASYMPVPFARGCKIIWQGDLRRLHFYHLQFLLFDAHAEAVTFSLCQLEGALPVLQKVADILGDANKYYPYAESAQTHDFHVTLEPAQKKQAYELTGAQAVEMFQVKVKTEDLDAALRQTVLYIWADECTNAQVASPIGDFLGVAPG